MNLVLHYLLPILFWACVLGLAHSYVVYPALVRFLARRKLRRQGGNRELVYSENDPVDDWPHIVVAMAAHNEEAVIGETLASIFQSQYPADRFEVLVAADNCSDGTHRIVQEFRIDHPENLALRIFPGRNGKIRVINQLLKENQERLSRLGDYVLVLCDANVRWSPELAKELAKHFRDPQLGLVASNVLDSRTAHDGIADQEEAYVNRENSIKHAEGVLWGRMMGAFGACYAMRGQLFEPVPEHFIVDDFYHTMRCFELGCDAIVEPAAVCYEDVSEDIGVEFRRKCRIATGNFQNLSRFSRLLLPGLGAVPTVFAFWSHKGLRWFGPFLLIGAFLSSAALAIFHPIYLLAFVGQVAGVMGAALENVLSRHGVHLKPLRFLRYFYLMNLALLGGFFRFLKGPQNSVWEPTRRVAHAGPPRPETAQETKAANPAAVSTSQS
ncbi:MAG: glycosyltransferase [Verrucomicrobiae bacterium]|nr:glycosyltransferase [Verrucomicrobiae bacterium]